MTTVSVACSPRQEVAAPCDAAARHHDRCLSCHLQPARASSSDCNPIPSTAPLPQELRQAGLRCGAYHADMEPGQREAVHTQWSAGGLQVICATIAFGMGAHTCFPLPGVLVAHRAAVQQAACPKAPPAGQGLCSHAAAAMCAPPSRRVCPSPSSPHGLTACSHPSSPLPRHQQPPRALRDPPHHQVGALPGLHDRGCGQNSGPQRRCAVPLHPNALTARPTPPTPNHSP